jgi:hypothetical protein
LFSFQLADLQEKFSMLSAEAGIARNQVEAMQTQRPKTAQRPKTPAVSAVLSLVLRLQKKKL